MLSEDWVYLLRTYKKASCLMWTSASLAYLWGDGRPIRASSAAAHPSIHSREALSQPRWKARTNTEDGSLTLMHTPWHTLFLTSTHEHKHMHMHACIHTMSGRFVQFSTPTLYMKNWSTERLTCGRSHSPLKGRLLFSQWDWSTHSNTSPNFENFCTRSFTPLF